jgi:hypothetical protein
VGHLVEPQHRRAKARQAIAPRLANQPAPDRARYLLSPILFPMEQPPAIVRPE